MLMRVWRKGNPPWKTVWRFLRKLKIELTYDPAIPLLRIYRQNDNSKRYMALLCL